MELAITSQASVPKIKNVTETSRRQDFEGQEVGWRRYRISSACIRTIWSRLHGGRDRADAAQVLAHAVTRRLPGYALEAGVEGRGDRDRAPSRSPAIEIVERATDR
jgi:hypothetical protein